MMGVCKSRKVNSPPHVAVVGASTTCAIGLDVGASVVLGKHAAFSPRGALSQHSEM